MSRVSKTTQVVLGLVTLIPLLVVSCAKAPEGIEAVTDEDQKEHASGETPELPVDAFFQARKHGR